MSAVAPKRQLSKAAVQRLRKQMPLAQRLKLARSRANLSLDRLGELAGTSRQHLIRLEAGQHKPKPEMARRIASATGVPVELLLDDEEEDDPAMRQAFDMFVALMGRINGMKAETEQEVSA